MAEALKDTPPVDFQVPEGMNLIAINRKTGMRANEGEPGTIMEAFKPGTGPADSYWVIGMDAGGELGESLSPHANRRHPGRRRRALLTPISSIGPSRPLAVRCSSSLGSRDGRTSGSPFLSALYSPEPRPYVPRRFDSSIPMESPIQPCARKPKNSSTKSGRRITLLRRHL